jgi:hypothetical protein
MVEMSPGVYDCAGLIVASDIALSSPEVARPADTADVVVTLGAERTTPFERPSPEVLAELVMEGFLCYTICRVGDGYVARLPWIADFIIDADLRHVVCHPVPDGRPGVIPIVIPGTIAAFILAMHGHCVLHGSAVEIDGRALAFVGASGQGKSTMAALCCAAGATLVTDDVLPLEFNDEARVTGVAETITCRRGEREIRLREKAASLAERFKGAGVRRTADARHAVTPDPSHQARVPLAAIVLPRPDRERDEVTARRLGDGEASLWLSRCQRIEGWLGRDHLRQQFEQLGRVAAAVPVFEVWVPWGPPFAEDLPARLREACGAEVPAFSARH